LPGGKSVLIAGDGGGYAELYDVANGTFSVLSSMLPEGPVDLAATLLADGRVLVTGGQKSDGVSSAGGIYGTGSQQFLVEKADARAQHTATLLPSGLLLVAGGSVAGDDAGASTASLFDPAQRTFTPTGPMTAPRVGHTATLVDGGRVLLAGGQP